MRKLILFLAALIIICSYMQSSVAEGRKTQEEFGNGAYGANRRVETGTEHIGVRGSFSEPDAHVPDPNTSHSAPTFYLGCHSGNAITEGGIQYADAGDGFDEGWSAFLRTTETVGKTVVSKWTSPAPNGSAWRVGIGSLGDTSLTMKVLLTCTPKTI